MTTIDLNQGSSNKGNKQTEKDSWTSLYLPAICAAILMGGVLFLAVGFSRKPQTVAKIGAPEQSAIAAPSQTAAMASVPETPKKKVAKKARPVNATYVNSTYGVSFSYPRKYSLQSGDKLGTARPSGFLKAGAVQVAAVDMPDDMYPETDFSSALLTVSVNPNMTAVECMQFVPASKDAGEVKPNIVKVGANEYSVFEQINGEGDKKSDLKYFHLFKNNACYEFALDVDTTVQPESELAQVDRGKVFQKLEKILTTAKIKDLEPTEVENADSTPATGLPIADNKVSEAAGDNKTAETKVADSKPVDVKSTEKTQNAQVVTPDQK